MARFLRFHPDDYQTLAHACHALPRHVGYADFQRLVVKILRTTHPPLAQQIAGLRIKEIRIIREHLDNEQASVRAAMSRGGEPGKSRQWNLTVKEWLIISQVYSLNCLRDETEGDEESLLVQVGEVSPRLARKLSRLSECQVAQLYRRVRSGKRWCP